MLEWVAFPFSRGSYPGIYLKILSKETEAQESKVIHPQSHSEQGAALGLQNLSSFSQILF